MSENEGVRRGKALGEFLDAYQLFCKKSEDIRTGKYDFEYQPVSRESERPLSVSAPLLLFHMTVAYFWIQVVDFALSAPAATFVGETTVLSRDQATKTSNDEFREFYKTRSFLNDEYLFMQYYSRKLIFHTPASMLEFALPDRKPLPSITNTVSTENK